MSKGNLARAAKELLRRRQARRSLHDFIRFINPDYIVSDFSLSVCEKLDKFLDNMMAGERPTLLLGAPPQHGKSDIVSRYLPAYVFGRWPNLRLGGLSYGADLAQNMNRDVQKIIMGDAYALLFPDTRLNSKRVVSVETMAKRNSEEFDIIGHRGSYVAAGVGGPLTGKSLDLGIIDDPIKNAEEALSPTTKQSIWNWYLSVFMTRLSKNSGQIIMATRWAQDDLTGRVMQEDETAEYIAYKAIDDDGKALVPELHPLEKLLKYKKLFSDYFWSAMYQQSPKPLGGSIFKETGVQYYLPKDLPKKFDKVVASWDMTFKDTAGTDYVVGQVWGKHGANFYLLDQVRDRMSFTATKAAVLALNAKWPMVTRTLVEDKANGPAVIDSLKDQMYGIVAVQPDGSKIARAHAITGIWEALNIFLPHRDIAPWVPVFVEEVTLFPAASNDDQVDGMTQAVRDMNTSGRGFFD